MMARKSGEAEGAPLDLVGRRAWVSHSMGPGRDFYLGGLLAPLSCGLGTASPG